MSFYNNGSTGTFGGTSCAAPLWAGFTALVNQQAVAAGRAPVGFLNPALYTIGRGASYTSNFHDITTGNNFSSSSPTKFSAVAGYDLCTGWGTPNGTNLINTLAGPPILAPLLVSNSFALVAEGCPNGVVDPAETVTVNFGLKNIGTANTTNLVATLLAAGGILSPSGPQTYGVVGYQWPVVAPAVQLYRDRELRWHQYRLAPVAGRHGEPGNACLLLSAGPTQCREHFLPGVRRRHCPGFAGGLDHFGQRRPIHLGHLDFRE